MRTLIVMLAAALGSAAQAAPQEPVWALAQKEKPAVIETLRELVNIESGSRDKEGLDRVAARLGERLAARREGGVPRVERRRYLEDVSRTFVIARRGSRSQSARTRR